MNNKSIRMALVAVFGVLVIVLAIYLANRQNQSEQADASPGANQEQSGVQEPDATPAAPSTTAPAGNQQAATTTAIEKDAGEDTPAGDRVAAKSAVETPSTAVPETDEQTGTTREPDATPAAPSTTAPAGNQQAAGTTAIEKDAGEGTPVRDSVAAKSATETSSTVVPETDEQALATREPDATPAAPSTTAPAGNQQATATTAIEKDAGEDTSAGDRAAAKSATETSSTAVPETDEQAVATREPQLATREKTVAPTAEAIAPESAAQTRSRTATVAEDATGKPASDPVVSSTTPVDGQQPAATAVVGNQATEGPAASGSVEAEAAAEMTSKVTSVNEQSAAAATGARLTRQEQAVTPSTETVAPESPATTTSPRGPVAEGKDREAASETVPVARRDDASSETAPVSDEPVATTSGQVSGAGTGEEIETAADRTDPASEDAPAATEMAQVPVPVVTVAPGPGTVRGDPDKVSGAVVADSTEAGQTPETRDSRVKPEGDAVPPAATFATPRAAATARTGTVTGEGDSNRVPDSPAASSDNTRPISPPGAVPPDNTAQTDTGGHGSVAGNPPDVADRSGQPETRRPSFEIAKVDPDGTVVLGGQAEPDRRIELKDGESVIGDTMSDATGAWLVTPENVLEPGAHVIVPSIDNGNGALVEGDQAMVIVIPEPGKDIAGNDSDGDRTPLAIIVPRDQAATRLAQVPGPTANTTPGPDEGGKAGDEGRQIARVFPEPEIRGEDDEVILDTVDYDEKGEAVMSGQSEAGTTVKVFIDDELQGTAAVADDGSWALRSKFPEHTEEHQIRIEQVAESGEVSRRIEIPFFRARPFDDLTDDVIVIVQPGNSLWRIARRIFGQGVRYTEIFLANADQIRDPHLIFPGQVFGLPQTN